MRHVREVLRLASAGVSKHEIARRKGLAPSTVARGVEALCLHGLGLVAAGWRKDRDLEARPY